MNFRIKIFITYNIEKYYKNFKCSLFRKSFFFYINNEKQFHDVYENKSSKHENKTKFKNDINVEFVIIFYYIMINKISEKLIYRNC